MKQLWNFFSEYLPPFWCPATQIKASLASQLTSVLNSDFCQNVCGSSACSCSVRTAWRQRAAESSGWCVCSPSLQEPSPGTLTLPAVQGLKTVSYFVQLSNSQWKVSLDTVPLIVAGRGTLSRAREWAHTCWQSNRLDWEGHPGGQQQGEEAQGTSLPRDLQSQVLWWWSWFPSCLWPSILTQGSFHVFCSAF